MKKIWFMVFLLLVMLGCIVYLLYNRNNNKQYNDYTNDSGIVVDTQNSVVNDGTELVKKYFMVKGIGGTIYTCSTTSEATPSKVYDYNVDCFYEIVCDGISYYAVVVDGEVIEIE